MSPRHGRLDTHLNDNAQTARAVRFHFLHARPGAFVIPNPWDAGSARMLAALGFEALATTSAGFAFSLGRPDAEGAVDRDDTLRERSRDCRRHGAARFRRPRKRFRRRPRRLRGNHSPARRAAGLVGGSIEDATGRADDPIYPFAFSVDRVAAAVRGCARVAISLRADRAGREPDQRPPRPRRYAPAAAGVRRGRRRRPLRAGLKTSDDIARVVQAVAPKPVNVVMGLSGAPFLACRACALGVKRVSVGSALARAAYGAFLAAAREIREQGTFTFAAHALPYAELNAMFRRGASGSGG